MLARLKLWASDHRKEIILFIAVFLVSACSFALGYIAALDNVHAPIIIEQY